MGRGFLLAAVAWAVAELGAGALVRRLRSDFPWLITPSDAAPEIPVPLVERHVAKSFDPGLGWCRRPGERGTDVTDAGVRRYAVDDRGRRRNPGFHGPAPVACFGDSYVFCRLVDDDETWPHLLSRSLGVNVANYGVGNYGLDQALLRLERELPTLEAQVVVMGAVPETIARVHSCWKHYFEYGNVLAFKPRFTLEPDGSLTLHESPVRTAADYATYRERLPEIIELDRFHDEKFRRDLLFFPYLPKLLRRARRHLPVLAHLTTGLGRGDEQRRRAARAAFEVVLRDNARWTARLYADPAACGLLRALVERFAAVCRAAGKEPMLLVVPQPVDLERRDRGTAHRQLFDGLRDTLPVVDLTERFRRDPRPLDLFAHGRLGPHCGPRGNALVAEALAPVVTSLLAFTHAGDAPPRRPPQRGTDVRQGS